MSWFGLIKTLLSLLEHWFNYQRSERDKQSGRDEQWRRQQEAANNEVRNAREAMDEIADRPLDLNGDGRLDEQDGFRRD